MGEQQPPDVGAQVRAWRERRGLSMRALAELCELSPNAISLIERGATSPSVSTLHRVATALQVPITAFFEDRNRGSNVIVSRPGERSYSGSGSMLLESLGSGLPQQTLQPFVVTLKPGADSGPSAIIHAGHELVFCLQGELEYRIDGQTYRLAPGESLLFEARLPHCWCNPSDADPVTFLLVFQSVETGEPLEQHLHP